MFLALKWQLCCSFHGQITLFQIFIPFLENFESIIYFLGFSIHVKRVIDRYRTSTLVPVKVFETFYRSFNFQIFSWTELLFLNALFSLFNQSTCFFNSDICCFVDFWIVKIFLSAFSKFSCKVSTFSVWTFLTIVILMNVS